MKLTSPYYRLMTPRKTRTLLRSLTISLSFFSLTTFSIITLYTPQALAASDAECGIWMCLPVGFTFGCDDARDAFKKRIKRLKSPLPSFSGCLVSAPGDSVAQQDSYTAKDGKAALLKGGKYCTEFSSSGACQESAYDPDYVIKGPTCRRYHDTPPDPKGCVQTISYTEIYKNGVLFGETAYY